jgi:hypothetical protein
MSKPPTNTYKLTQEQVEALSIILWHVLSAIGDTGETYIKICAIQVTKHRITKLLQVFEEEK